MTTLESLILSYIANALWQIPLVFGAGWIAARAVRRLGSGAEHRVWVSVLLLQVILPAASVVPWETLRRFLAAFFGGSIHSGQSHVAVVVGPGIAFGSPQLPAWLLATTVVAYCTVTAWFSARFMWRLQTVRRISHSATATVLSPAIADHWALCSQTFAVKDASLCTTPHIYGPVTIGIRRKLLLLPPDMLTTLPDAELRTAISHEFAHIYRHDFLKNLLYELLSLPVRFHPVLYSTRLYLMETREMVCDQLAANPANRRQYARSLLRLASLIAGEAQAHTHHAIGMFDAGTLERRVMRLTEKKAQPSAVRRFITSTACALLGAGICAVALTVSVHVNAQAASDQQRASGTTGPVNVKPGVMARQLLHKVIPVYPADAKKAGIQGHVQLRAIIDKTGKVEDIKVVSGPKELQQSAIDAVKQWLYKPYLLNGKPVEVKTTINIIYTLQNKASKPKGSNPPPPPSNQ